jgi:hypothetical protein
MVPPVILLGLGPGAAVAALLGAMLTVPVLGTLREILSWFCCKVLGDDPYPPEEEEAKLKEAFAV